MHFQEEWRNLKYTAQQEWHRLTYKNKKTPTKKKPKKDNFNPKWFILAHAALGMSLVNIYQLTGIQAWIGIDDTNADTVFAGIVILNGLILLVGYLISEKIFQKVHSKFSKIALATLWILLYLLSNAVT